MKLYLAQHGDATSKEENPDRPLSRKGAIDTENIARFLGRTNITVASVAHSGKLRAEQTAEILIEQLIPGIAPAINHNINPLDLPAVVAEEIEQWLDDVLLVGHLPHLAKLATLLLTSHEQPAIITFTPGTVACLERNEDGHWSLKWLLSPELMTQKE
ncbi:MAG: phosphohistidine phosphatase SixA [Acidiferrobacterales bacterium]